MIAEKISHYRLLRRLGAGGMGDVYLAEDLTLSRRVAIKFLSSDRESRPDARRRLVREAKAAAGLDHPNICPVFEVGSDAGRDFIVMQYVEGETLASRLQRGALPVREAVEICAQVAEALGAAHEQGVIHRDIKPQNVIITPRGVAKVLDFGLAKALPTADDDAETATGEGALTQAGTVMGTAPYMAPEQIRLEPVDQRTDLFALGAVLYECLTGRRAFQGRSWPDVCGQVLHVEPPPPSSIVPAVPATLDSICLRLLAKNRAQRFDSSEKVIAALRADLAEPSAPATAAEATDERAGGPRPAWRYSRYRAAIAAVVLLVALLMVVAVLPRLRNDSAAAPPEAQRWLDIGTAALRQGSYLTAVNALQEALAIQDPFPVAHARLAEAQAELDESDLALASILHARTNLPDLARLDRTDALYVEAITASVSRDFDASIAAYAELAELTPESATVHFDLGRALEADDRLEEALESYGRAIELDPLFAPAFMRQGILRGRDQRLQAAIESFQQAEALFQASGNFEGVGTTVYHRGALLNGLDQLADARVELERALDLARATDHRYLQILTLRQLSNLTATEGSFEEAEAHARSALALARGRQSLTAAALIDLGNVFFMSRDLDSTEERFLEGLELASRVSARRTEARAQLSLGSLALTRGELEEAARFTEQGLPFFREGRYRKEMAQAMALLGLVFGQRGDSGRARIAFEELSVLAAELNDPSITALAHDGLGRTLAQQGQYPAALGEFDRSSEIYEQQGNRVGRAYIMLERSALLWRIGRPGDAQAILESLTTDPELEDILRPSIGVVLAGSALSERRLADASRLAAEAVSVGSADERTAIEADALLALARIAAGRDPGTNLATARDAAARAGEVSDPVFELAIRVSYAEALLEAGEPEAALEEVAGLPLDTIDHPELVWRSHAITAVAASRVGNDEAARTAAARGRAKLDTLASSWGPEAFQGFIARADVARLRQEAAEHEP